MPSRSEWAWVEQVNREREGGIRYAYRQPHDSERVEVWIDGRWQRREHTLLGDWHVWWHLVQDQPEPQYESIVPGDVWRPCAPPQP